ncbi:MAG: DUF6442 family protein [Inconstantimicrobium porci]|uniref:DUF6442 family protein n=1 Tax=Inconstantimicrobium porci TaxID=2652291 RepID=UPI002A90A193|nr:DUF6442 family protein [Inconstantimicrobium porci]MDY5911196.1 DUF6442 family protein [Inconstantimicrobium porci]
MNKEEILAKSRKEHKDQDIYEKEVLKEAGNVGAISACVLCLIFFCAQIFTGGGTNYGLWAIIFAIRGGEFFVKGIRLKRKHEIVLAVMYIVITLAMSTAHIYNLLSAAK